MPHRILSILHEVWSFLTTLVMAVVMYLFPIKNFVHLVAILITIDFITGIWASLKVGEKITATRMGKTVNKLLLYSLAIIASYVLQRIADDGIGLARICALYIGATELKSIYENISRVFGFDLFGQLWTLIKVKVDDFISGITIKKNGNPG
ncbi:MAG: Uncharacterized protein FD166_3612 [Bacteroidetes bacterium]|nr:MAG: Uncharacterized protein FD166_3612 [Bacteroidota bacterium]